MLQPPVRKIRIPDGAAGFHRREAGAWSLEPGGWGDTGESEAGQGCYAWRPFGPGFTFPRPEEATNCVDAEMGHPESPSPKPRRLNILHLHRRATPTEPQLRKTGVGAPSLA